jgi:hypothetical protein
MTTLDDLRQRLEDRYLEPVVEHTPSVPLTGDLNSTDLTFTIIANVLSPDEESLIGPGAFFELGSEIVLCTDYNPSTQLVTVIRGRRGTTAAAHLAADDEFRFPTRWTRKTQHESLTDAIASLWPPLFVIEEQRATIETAGYLALPLDTIRIISVKYQDSYSQRWRDITGTLFSTHPLDETLASVQIDPLPYPSALCVVRYGRKVTAPSTVTGEIDLLPTGWERIVLVDAAAELLAGVDIDAVTQETLTQQMRLEGFPVKSGASISTSLIRYREYLMSLAKAELTHEQPKRVTHMQSPSPLEVWR